MPAAESGPRGSTSTARNGPFPPTGPDPDPEIQSPATPDSTFNEACLPALITFFRQIGLGFGKEVRDRCAEDGSDVDDLDVGPIGSPAPTQIFDPVPPSRFTSRTPSSLLVRPTLLPFLANADFHLFVDRT